MGTDRKAYYIMKIRDRDIYNMSAYQILERTRSFHNARDILRELATKWSNDFVIMVEETDLNNPPPNTTE